MRERVRYEPVKFNRPFVVTAVNRIQAGGLYKAETTEASVEGLSFAAFRVVSASIMLPLRGVAPTAYRLVPIDIYVVRATRMQATRTMHYGRPWEV